MCRRVLTLLAVLALLAGLSALGTAAATAHVDRSPGEAVVAGSTGASTTSTAPAATATTEDRPGTTLEAQARDDEGSLAPWLIGSGVAAAIAVGAGGLVLRRRTG